MNKLLIITTSLTLLLTSCGQSNDLNIGDYVDHWEITKNYNTYNNSKLSIDTVENEYQIVSGNNQILIVTIEKNPIFKEGKELTDLYSTKSLLLELDTADNYVTAEKPQNSGLFRKLIAFSPDYGINLLKKEEKITLTRGDKTIWKVEVDISDFVFSGQLDFATDQTLTEKTNNY
jgi:hypothetical protein